MILFFLANSDVVLTAKG